MSSINSVVGSDRGRFIWTGVYALTAVTATLFFSGCGSPKIASVGGSVITQKEFVAAALKTPAAANVLNFLIANRVLEQEAKKKGVLPTQAQVDAFLKDLVKTNPELQHDIDSNRSDIMVRAGFVLKEVNLMAAQDAGLTDAKEKAWFQSHHALFDQQPAISIAVVVCNDAKSASNAKAMLANGISPTDVASSFGTSKWPENGKPSPPITRDQLTQSYGPALNKVADVLYSPNTKVGYTTDPIPSIFGSKDKVGVVQLVSRTPGSPAKFDSVKFQVIRFMAAEDYARTVLKAQIPAGLTVSQYEGLAQQAGEHLMRTLVGDYFKANKINIQDSQLQEQMKMQYGTPMPGPGGPPTAPNSNPSGQ